jgi:inosine-uridine nucleoside N-ribohydrolase
MRLFVLLIVGAFTACISASEEETRSSVREGQKKLILDTDIAADCDDAGAVAVLHALANKQEVQIVGMMVSMPVEYGAPALDAINTYYNRPNIPIGTLKNSGDGARTGGLKTYNEDLARRFANDLKHSTYAKNAVTLYRELLSKSNDTSIVILTLGPLTNLYHLMKSLPDSISSLDGMALIRKKVKRLVTAGGRLPEGSSYNFWIAPEKTEHVINHWPTEYWFVPNQLGDSVLTGTDLMQRTDLKNPVRMAYSLYKAAHPDRPFRPSWDQMGVIVAVRGEHGIFASKSNGVVVAKRDKIKWQHGGNRDHRWFVSEAPFEVRRKLIEDLMTQAPSPN